jgi:hypothetical protein
MRLITSWSTERRRDLRATRDHLRQQLDAARAANRALAQQVGELVDAARTRPALPDAIQALVDWYLRKPVTAVLDLPKRDSVRAALEQWRTGHVEPDRVLAFPGEDHDF